MNAEQFSSKIWEVVGQARDGGLSDEQINAELITVVDGLDEEAQDAAK